MRVEELAPMMQEWATRARSKVEVSAGLVLISNGGGEIRDYVRPLGDQFALTNAERGSDEQFEMTSPSLLDIARYLTDTYGGGIRSAVGLPFLYRSPPPIQPAAGWVVDEVEISPEFSAAFPARKHSLGAPHKVGQPPTALFSGDTAAKIFTHIADLSLEQIQALYLAAPTSDL